MNATTTNSKAVGVVGGYVRERRLLNLALIIVNSLQMANGARPRPVGRQDNRCADISDHWPLSAKAS